MGKADFWPWLRKACSSRLRSSHSQDAWQLMWSHSWSPSWPLRRSKVPHQQQRLMANHQNRQWQRLPQVPHPQQRLMANHQNRQWQRLPQNSSQWKKGALQSQITTQSKNSLAAVKTEQRAYAAQKLKVEAVQETYQTLNKAVGLADRRKAGAEFDADNMDSKIKNAE